MSALAGTLIEAEQRGAALFWRRRWISSRLTRISSRARAEILELFCGNTDYLVGKTAAEKVAVLESMSYIDFLAQIVGASDETRKFFRMWRASYMGDGTDLGSAIGASASSSAIAVRSPSAFFSKPT